ncbi:uncharacterized protein LOC124915265 isoform X2 [Impatiens glandulifera]|nr:uncharacterized protein LOC124915265 isoform X2 [Impatiens glandulifera]
MTAAKILFTSDPPNKKKKFGLDFHLVQLFFTCLPSLAVYLVAQYARYEIRRMEAELEVKKAREEEEEAAKAAKELESNGDEEKVAEIPPEILKVNERLDKLEETIKEIVNEPKRQAGLVSKDHQEDNNTSEKRPQKTTTVSSDEDSTNEKMKRSDEPVDLRDNQKKT